MVTVITTTATPGDSRQHRGRDRWRILTEGLFRDAREGGFTSAKGRGRDVRLKESKKVALYSVTKVASALTRAMRVCEPKQQKGRTFIGIHITKVWQVQSNSK
jgi:hypothetical protein